MLYYLVGQDREAITDLDQVIADAPQTLFAYFWRAMARARLGRAAEARQDVATFHKWSKDTGANLFVDAIVAVILEGDARGLERLEAALARRPHDSYLRAFYGAGAYAVAAQAVAGKSPEQARTYADRAVALLREVEAGGSVGHGYFDYSGLLKSWQYDSLREHSGFRELMRQGRLDLFVAAVWNDSADEESAESHWLDPVRHLARCCELAADGYRPAAVSVLDLGDGQPPVTASAWNRPVIPHADREARARRQAQVAATLLRLGRPNRVWPLLRHSPDPRVRTHLTHNLSALGLDAATLIRRLDEEPDISARRALILGLGQFPKDRLPADVRDPLAARLLSAYREDPDPGLRAAARWLLCTPSWGQGEQVRVIDRELAEPPPDAATGKAAARRWYVNKEGLTMVVIPGPVEFSMGSPAGEPDWAKDEPLHRERIPRSFAIADREVTMAQFQRFWLQTFPNQTHSHAARYSPDPDCPAIDLTWLEAAQFCRWLSEQEGVPEDQMCFPPIGEIKEGMVLPEDYLHRTGYRLPTMAEWEYAARAGADTSRFYGGSRELLGRYARYSANSDDRAWPVGRLLPNDFGLFDVYGNVSEWCMDHRAGIALRGARGQVREDWESPNRLIPVTASRARCGGSFLDPAGLLRSACWGETRATSAGRTYGLRVARTVR
jgi:formylglycine-generating enzyme required for sulfatase activity